MLGNPPLKWAFALALAGSASACFLGEISLEGLPCPCADGYVCDATENVCKAAVQNTTSVTSAGGGSAGGGSAGGGAVGGGGTGGGCGNGGSPPVAKPLVAVQNATSLAVYVDGMFRIEADAGHNWMLGRWFDLATDPLQDLSGHDVSDVFVDRWSHDSTDWNNSGMGDLVGVAVADETPARFTVTTTIDYQLPGLRLTQTSTFYASGKVAMSSVFSNTTGSTLTITDSEYHYTSVNESLDWAATSVDFDHSVGFSRLDGPGASTAQVVNFEDNLLESDAANTNRYWHETSFNLAANGGAVQQDGVLFVAPSSIPSSIMAARSEDARAPGLVLGAGAALVGTGYSESEATYTLSATSPGSVTFGVDGTHARYAPTFVISDWTAPAWHIERGGEILVSSDAPLGPASVAQLNTSTGKLVFVYEGSIDPGASDCERSFTLVAD